MKPTVKRASGPCARGRGIERRQHIAPARGSDRAACPSAWARVRLLAVDDDFVAAHVLHAGHDADRLGLLFEDRSLLDVHLERRLDRLALQSGRRCGIAQPLEFMRARSHRRDRSSA